MEEKFINSLREVLKNRKPVRNVNIEHRQHLSKLDRIAIFITSHVGTMGFFLIIFTWTVSWLGWNTFAPVELRFDPFPAFVLWLIISNIIQISLTPLIMIGQNLQGRHAEARTEADFEINMRVEKETEAILSHLEKQSELILEILQKLENKNK